MPSKRDLVIDSQYCLFRRRTMRDETLGCTRRWGPTNAVFTMSHIVQALFTLTGLRDPVSAYGSFGAEFLDPGTTCYSDLLVMLQAG